MKKCISCKQEKEIIEFAKDKYNKTGLQSECKVCRIQRIKTQKYSSQKKWNDKKRSEGYFKQYKGGSYWNDYQKTRRQKDPYYSLYINLRSRISNLLSGKSKSKRTEQIIGLPINEFKLYIESKWIEGMSWENYGYGEGKWVLDHIFPISRAKTEQELFILNHYSNLQPMWWRKNLIKSNKIT